MSNLNLWMETLMAKLEECVSEIKEQSEYFDFMTVFKRVLAHPVLSDFNFMIKETHDSLEATEDVDKWRLQAQGIVGVMKIERAFKEIVGPTVLDDLRNTSYDLREPHTRNVPEYTFMEFYWIYIAWNAFGDDTLLPTPMIGQILANTREQIKQDKDFTPETPVARIVGTPSADNEFPAGQVDVLRHMLQRMDQNLTVLWEMEKVGSSVTTSRRALRDLH